MPGVPEEFVAFAHRLADAAGAVQRRYFRTPVTVDIKEDDSPVTIADREAEAAMRTLIARHHPGHGVLGEEHGSDRLDAEWVWVLDPIDGTRSFITGRALFGTLIALCHRGVPVLGMIDQSIMRERWLGRSGARSTMNGNPLATRACPDPSRAVLHSTSPYLFADGHERDAFERLAAQVSLPFFGCDCYAYGLLAMGFVDLVVEAGLGVYDYMALVPVIEGAGGRITDWQGRPPGFGSDGRVVAAGDGRVHEAVLRMLGEKTAS